MSEPLGTPGAVAALEEAVRTDLASVSGLFGEGARLLAGLEEVLRMLPSSQSRIKGWANQVEHIMAGIAEEQADISRKLLGGDPQLPIAEFVDGAHLEVVRAAKDDAA